MLLNIGRYMSPAQSSAYASLDINFLESSSLPSIFSFTRVSQANYINGEGLLVTASANQARFEYTLDKQPKGLLIEASATNIALYNRDLTQAVWSATSAAILQDQVGLDGEINAASSVTAISSNATVFQTITASAVNRCFSLYIKRLSGTGAIEVSQDGGTSYYDVTANLVINEWVRVVMPSQSVTNPQIGLRIATASDSIAVDCLQLENGNYVSSPIITTSSSVTRAQDLCLFNDVDWLNQSSGTFFMQASVPSTLSSSSVLWNCSNNTYAERYVLLLQGGSTPRGLIIDNSIQSFLPGTSVQYTQDIPFKCVLSYNAESAYFKQTGETAFTAETIALPTVTQSRLGSDHLGNSALSAHIQKIQYYPSRLSNKACAALVV